MSAAVTRAQEALQGTKESTQPSAEGELATRPVIEAIKVTAASQVSVNDHGMTPLMHAVRDGSAGTVQALLMRAVDVNARRSDGFNALSLAAFFGHSQVVWLLLENGADLDGTDRSGTLPELWADARGFIDIGNILREARARKDAETSSRQAALMDEPARFPRPAEREDLQRVSDSEPAVEAHAATSETTLETDPAPVAEEKAVKRTDSAPDIRVAAAEQTPQQPVIHQPPRGLKALPEIIDPPPLLVPAFHPGSAFVARITSSWKNVAALTSLSVLLCAGTAVLLIPQLKSLAGGRTPAVTEPAQSTSESANSVPGSGSDLPATVEIPTERRESPAAEPSRITAETTANSNSDEATSGVESVAVPEKGPDSSANSGSSTPISNRIVETGENKRAVSAVSTRSRVAAPSRTSAVSRNVKSDKPAMAEEQPKPAPLSVEGTRPEAAMPTRNVSGNQTAPLHITSDKPKSKVIQWP